MYGLTNYITECDWMEVLTTWFVLIDTAYRALGPAQRQRRRGPAPQMSDSEVITVSLFCDTYFHGSEELGLACLRQAPFRTLFPKLLSNSRFNRRRRALATQMEAIRQSLNQHLIDPDDDLRLVDSAPVPVCTYGRSAECMTVQGAEYASVMPSRKAKLYGFHVVLTTTLDQVVDQWLLAPAAPHDNKTGRALLSESEWLMVLGDNGFHDPVASAWLQTHRQITLLAPPQAKARKDQWPAELRHLVVHTRRRIESAIAVLATVFHIEQPGSRSLVGLVTRVTSRLLAHAISFRTTELLRQEQN
jgi:hypothetical protein